MSTEYGWVIEKYLHSALYYWTGDPKNPWQTDNLKALRFARRTDAERMQSWHCDGEGRVAEHGWG